VAGDHYARAESDAGGHAVGLAKNDGGDPEVIGADFQCVADLGVKADEQIVVDKSG